jgi:hypothetical protein
LFWSNSYVVSHCLAVVPQSGAKEQFHSSVYYLILNSNCEAQRGSRNFGGNVKERVRSLN